MNRYRSRPTEIEAVQWTGDNLEELEVFAGERVRTRVTAPQVEITLDAGVFGAQGAVPVPRGHWVVRNPGDDTDYWPVDPDYFDNKYELVF